MSWQCPKCETVNQDVTPVCTVCDSIAPVIESYLSLEAIELLREYNEKLDSIHFLEAEGNFEAMLDTSMEAIALYKENGLALDKAKHALIHLNNAKLKSQFSILLNNAIEKKNYIVASALLKLIDSFSIESSEFFDICSEVRSQLSRKNEIEKILDESYKAIVELDTTKALQIVEDGLSKFSSSKLLQFRRDDIKKLISSLSSIRETEEKRKPFPRHPHKRVESIVTSLDCSTDTTLIDLKPQKHKYPKVKRK